MNQYGDILKTLVAASLFEKPGSYVVEEIFKKFPNTDLVNATEEELMQIKGIGKSRARQITSLIQLTKEFNKPYTKDRKIKSPKDVFELVRAEMQFLKKEHFILLMLSTKNDVIAKEVISIGTLNAAIVHPREVYYAAIKRCSAAIIAIHNHPSGDPSPSQEDIDLTKRLVLAGNVIGIELLDHVIVGNDVFVSFKEKGFM
ncbi:RadC family protein [Paenibacillus sp. HW567]|uniref:RadC family protein n=1 Tax=Paenibacillus sp. HW567 TaxID=1034769 RepID=UPI0003697FF9|nr:DNA repair protein RadC [Paenibacillus sp. HW567]